MVRSTSTIKPSVTAAGPETASAALPTVCSTQVISSLSMDPPGPCSMPSSRSDSRRRTCSRNISVCTCAHATASR